MSNKRSVFSIANVFQNVNYYSTIYVYESSEEEKMSIHKAAWGVPRGNLAQAVIEFPTQDVDSVRWGEQLVLCR